jgi:hypothetical protein
VSAAPSGNTGSCSDVEVVFARGTDEPAGVGKVGQAFVDSLRPKIGPKSMAVYAVDYPATMDFPRAMSGINDASSHVEQMATSCPNTKMVLGGYSQGAAIMGFVTSAAIPDGVLGGYSQGAAIMGFVTSAAIPDGAPEDAPRPMPTDVANHVAAVTLFSTPSDQFMSMVGQPGIVIGPAYMAKTTQLCASGDPICSSGGNWAVHDHYATDATIEQGAAFAAGRISQP